MKPKPINKGMLSLQSKVSFILQIVQRKNCTIVITSISHAVVSFGQWKIFAFMTI